MMETPLGAAVNRITGTAPDFDRSAESPLTLHTLPGRSVRLGELTTAISESTIGPAEVLTYVGDGEDYEAFGNNGMRAYTVRITARHDGGPSGTPRETSATVYVDITDVNEAPVFSGTIDDAMNDLNGKYDFDLPEMLDGRTTPYDLGPITVSDPEGDFIALTVTPDAMFDILDGRTLRYRGDGQNYDESSGMSATATITATDGGSGPGGDRPTPVQAYIRIIDYPLFDQVFKPETGGEYKYMYSFPLKEGTTKGTVIGRVQAVSRTGLNVEYAIDSRTGGNQGAKDYSDNAHLDIDPTSGIISYISEEDTVHSALTQTRIPTITLTIEATEQKDGCASDNNDCETSKATVEIKHTGAGGLLIFPASPLAINLPENEATTAALTPDVRTATGGSPPYTYSLTGTRSSLFTIGADFRIRYTGNGESSDFSFTLQVRDAAGTTRTRTVRVDVGGTGGGGGGGGGTNRAPIFARSTYTFDIDRNEPGPVTLGRVAFSDPDDDALTASLSGTGSDLFLAQQFWHATLYRTRGIGHTGCLQVDGYD